MFIKNRVILGGRHYTDAFDVDTGELVNRVERISVANTGHLAGVGDTIVGMPDGKHGNKYELLPPIKGWYNRQYWP